MLLSLLCTVWACWPSEQIRQSLREALFPCGTPCLDRVRVRFGPRLSWGRAPIHVLAFPRRRPISRVRVCIADAGFASVVGWSCVYGVCMVCVQCLLRHARSGVDIVLSLTNRTESSLCNVCGPL